MILQLSVKSLGAKNICNYCYEKISEFNKLRENMRKNLFKGRKRKFNEMFSELDIDEIPPSSVYVKVNDIEGVKKRQNPAANNFEQIVIKVEQDSDSHLRIEDQFITEDEEVNLPYHKESVFVDPILIDTNIENEFPSFSSAQNVKRETSTKNSHMTVSKLIEIIKFTHTSFIFRNPLSNSLKS